MLPIGNKSQSFKIEMAELILATNILLFCGWHSTIRIMQEKSYLQ